MTLQATPTETPAPAGGLYQTIWRWHFYAGLICLPFFILLATTGALYLFRDELSLIFEKKLLVAESTQTARLSPEVLIDRALAVQPGAPVRYTPPPAPGRTAEVGVRDAAGVTMSVFLDPATGAAQGDIADDARLMKVVSHIHSLAILGPIPNLIIEVVGGWAILLVISGLFLWWPRGRRGGVVTVRASPGRRIWWRDLHAVTGAFACILLLFLAVTGMPWSGYWGKHYRDLVNQWGQGMPAAVKPTSVSSDLALAATARGSWTMDASTPPSSVAVIGAPLPLQAVITEAKKLGLPADYVIRLPAGPEGVYTLQSYPKAATGQRVVHLDQYSGRVLADVGFGDYGAMSKATEWGIAVHTGGQYGRLNQLIMLAACLAIIAMSVAAAVMWWKRRPQGRLGAPPPRPGRWALSGFAVVALAVGLLYPLLGLSIVAALVIDRLVPQVVKIRRAL